ncbi:MAG: hypothetical protein ACRD29_04325 [Acidimicrobiales bacterium]
MAFDPTDDLPWLSEDPTAGTIAPDATRDVTVTADASGLAPGTYLATLAIATNDPLNTRPSVPVTLVVTPPG